MAKLTRVTAGSLPFGRRSGGRDWNGDGVWRAKWITLPRGRGAAVTTAFRNRFTLSAPVKLPVGVTADAVYRLWIDGVEAACGPELGDVRSTFVDLFEFEAGAGEHTLVAMVSSFGGRGPLAKVEFEHGFLFAAAGGGEAEKLESRAGNWEALPVPGHTWEPVRGWAASVGQEMSFDASGCPAGIEHGGGEGWLPVTELWPGGDADLRNEFGPQPLLRAATLPAMETKPVRGFSVRYAGPFGGRRFRAADNRAPELAGFGEKLRAGGLEVPAHTELRLLLELDDYYCARPRLVTSKGRGAKISLGWAEALMTEEKEVRAKADRTGWRDRFFFGIYDHFLPDGRDRMAFWTAWYRAGRFVSLEIATGEEPLRIDRFLLEEFRYPLEFESSFESGCPDLDRLAALSRRTLEMCSHDTFMDCPYYEQLMYLGDTRIQALLTLAVSRDGRLVEKALRMFAAGQLGSGLFQSRYPSRVTQVIPTFSPFFIGMLEDYARWRGGPLVAELLPAARRVADAYERWAGADGLVSVPRTWCFVDWAAGWPAGVPPEAERGLSGIVNALYLYGLGSLANLYELTGDAVMAGYFRCRASALADAVIRVFWREKRGLFADTADGGSFSEHMQILMLLSDTLPEPVEEACAAGLCGSEELTRATVYFSFYLFEAYRKLNRPDLFDRRLGVFREMDSLGLATLLEEPEPSRSDCHAWSAHILWHFYASMLGVRPAGYGFRAVEVRPQLLPGRRLRGRVVHPAGGTIDVELDGGAVVTLPPGLYGTYHAPDGRSFALKPGRNEIKG
ncbi:MAG: alpha-L-rhamnosidase [Lentisphaeria bacterium]|nr:alpha-L-rhamnosidase [Lentisphaeria bacterium]